MADERQANREKVIDMLRGIADLIEAGEEDYAVYAICLSEDKKGDQYTWEGMDFTPGRLDALTCMHMSIAAEVARRNKELRDAYNINPQEWQSMLDATDETKH